MSAQAITNTPHADSGRGRNVALWILQGLLGAFFLVAAAAPKLFGEATAVEMFDDIGVGQWFRYLVGGLELVGAIGLVVPRVAGWAALGLAGVMAGAVVTSLFVLDAGWLTITPAILLALCGVIAWGRRRQIGG